MYPLRTGLPAVSGNAFMAQSFFFQQISYFGQQLFLERQFFRGLFPGFFLSSSKDINSFYQKENGKSGYNKNYGCLDHLSVLYCIFRLYKVARGIGNGIAENYFLISKINTSRQQSDGGSITPFTVTSTILLKEAPTIIPTAKSITFPRMANSLNSFKKPIGKYFEQKSPWSFF